jgi:hypothetical protein
MMDELAGSKLGLADTSVNRQLNLPNNKIEGSDNLLVFEKGMIFHMAGYTSLRKDDITRTIRQNLRDTLDSHLFHSNELFLGASNIIGLKIDSTIVSLNSKGIFNNVIKTIMMYLNSCMF